MRMKVLLDTYKLAFQSPGGGEVIIEKLYEHLSKQGIDVHYFNKWQHKISDFDIIHQINTVEYRPWFYYRNLKTKFVLTPTRWVDTNSSNILKRRAARQFKKIFLPKQYADSESHAMSIPDRFLPTTDIEGERLQKYFNLPKEKFTTIYNGINQPLSLSTENAFMKKYNVQKYALFVGNISPVKNVDLIIKACENLKLPLFIIGGSREFDNEYFKECQFIASHSTTFVDRIENNDPLLAYAYSGAQMLINASDFETCSLVGLEAGSYATPVIMTEVGGTKEVYKDLVEFVNPRNLDSLINAIQRTLKKNGTDLALANYINEKYQWKKITSQVIEVYEQLLK